MSSSPSWQPLRTDAPVPPILPGSGRVTIALVAGPGVGETGWAADAAVALARAWAASDQPTFLCDLALEVPDLHRAAGVANHEGVSDMLCFGASPRRVAIDLHDGLFLAPAGTLTAEPARLRASPRWSSLVDAFQEAGGLLLLYVPAGAPGIEAVLARADGVVLLSEVDDRASLGEAESRLLAVFGPETGPSSASPDAAPEAPESLEGPVFGEGPDMPGRPDESPPSSPARGTATSGRPASPRSGWGCFRWGLMLLVLVALVLVLVAAMGWIRLPGIGLQNASATLVADRTGPDRTEALDEARPDDPVQAWGLTLEAHLDADAATGRAADLTERYPDLLFWVAPIRVRDQRFHRVLAGPATDPDEVEVLRARLGGSASWIPRRVGLAFLLGELPDLEAARTFAGVLADLEIPTHVLEVSAPNGGALYRVFAGGYANEDEAAELADMLRQQDFGSAPLTERRGVVPA